jgi:hypothetical protein
MARIKHDISSKKNNYSGLTCVTGLWFWLIQPPIADSLFFFEERFKNPAYIVFCTPFANPISPLILTASLFSRRIPELKARSLAVPLLRGRRLLWVRATAPWHCQHHFIST